MPDHPTPERIMAVFSAYQGTQTLKGAIELGIFTEIAAGFDTAPKLAERCKVDEHGVATLCDALTVMGFLEKHAGAYRPAPDAAFYLDKRSPAYVGGMTEFLLAPELVAEWNDVAGAVRRGGAEGLANTAPEHPLWIAFARGMAPFAAATAKMIAGIIMKGGAPKKVLDIAAGHGLYGIEMAKAAPEAQIVALDWPKVLDVARENVKAAGVEDRWSTRAGSAFDLPFGEGYDLVLLTNFLHHFDAATCEGLLRKTYAALAPGGRVATLEFIPNEDGVSPPFAAMFGMVMLTSTPKGRAYRYSELEAIHRAAGFADCALVELPPTPQRLVVARKAA